MSATIHSISHDACTGCGACVASCPQHCIDMEMSEGFAFPRINAQLCISCGKCQQVCPQLHLVVNPKQKPIGVYGGFSKDAELLQSSSSGAIFPLLCKHVISNKGVVYGACFNEKFNVAHQRLTTWEDCKKAFRSKYLQSNFCNCFSTIREDLNSGRLVLVSGTPCQISAIYNFLGRRHPDNLILVDIICHGVPSPQIWSEYLNATQDVNSISTVNFRDKSNGWEDFGLEIISNNGNTFRESLRKNLYFQFFLQDICLRESCYHCRQRTIHRDADITLGDFWGVKKKYPTQFNPNGTSLILVHSNFGKQLLENITPQVKLWEADLKYCLKKNAIAKSPKTKPQRRAFLDDWHHCNLLQLMSWHTAKPTFCRNILCRFTSIFRNIRRKYINEHTIK